MEKKLENMGSQEPKKLSYEELENVCHQLSAQAQQLNSQCKQLKEMLNELNLTNLYKRLDYLFNIIEKDNKYFSDEFKKGCAEEIESLMEKPEAEEQRDDSKSE